MYPLVRKWHKVVFLLVSAEAGNEFNKIYRHVYDVLE